MPASTHEETVTSVLGSSPPGCKDGDATSPESRALRRGPRRLGDYAVISKVGEGGMADVYLAVQRGPLDDIHKLVVLKWPRAQRRADPDLEKMFAAEARIAARLDHPNVIQTHAIDIVEGTPILVMEYLEGVSLRDLVRATEAGSYTERLPLMRAGSEALSGLHYVHDFRDYDGEPLRLIHRDIKPGNLFVTFDGRIKVLDFGIAKATALEATASHAIKGTARYMAPEIVGQSRNVDRRADLFSVGVMLWELASGRRLWESLDNLQILRRLADNQIPTIASVDAEIPLELSQICEQALQTDPEQRYPDAASLKRDLDAFLDAQTPVPTVDAVVAIAEEHFGDLRRARAEEVKVRFKEVVAHFPQEGEGLSTSTEDGTLADARRPLDVVENSPRHWLRPAALGAGAMALLGLGLVTVASVALPVPDPPTPADDAAPAKVELPATVPVAPQVRNSADPAPPPEVAPAPVGVDEPVHPDDPPDVQPQDEAPPPRRKRRHHRDDKTSPARPEPQPSKTETKTKTKTELELDKASPWSR